MRKAFTLIELVVAMGILAVILAFAGTIFKVGAESHRVGMANAEIMQKLRVITEQLNADFRGLRKEGEIFVVWDAARKPSYPGSNANAPGAFERFDRIMFFTTGDFQAFDANSIVRGDAARVCYTLASRLDGGSRVKPEEQKPAERMLMRTQHILVTPQDQNDVLDTSGYDDVRYRQWNTQGQYDNISLSEWMKIPRADKVEILSVVGDVTVQDPNGAAVSRASEDARGVVVDFSNAHPVHALLADGVGQFAVQGWSDSKGRWLPQLNPDADSALDDDSDFILDGSDLHAQSKPGLWYPYGGLQMRDVNEPSDMVNYSVNLIDQEHFAEIPGLGRALKFTFTLYDSKGLIPDGRTFTHIVYLDD